jgi:hypothetical protein
MSSNILGILDTELWNFAIFDLLICEEIDCIYTVHLWFEQQFPNVNTHNDTNQAAEHD